MTPDVSPTAATRCPHCGTPVPALRIETADLERTWQHMCKSPSMVKGEIALAAGCTLPQAAQWVEHLAACCRSWPLAPADAALAARIDAAFGAVARPADFCDELHDPECRDHNEELKARTSINLRRVDLGVQGWDPTGFITPAAMGHLFPALARYALMPAAVQGDRGDYAVQLAWHLEGNRAFHAWCSEQQRAAVDALLQRILESKSDEFEFSNEADRLLSAISLWSGGLTGSEGG